MFGCERLATARTSRRNAARALGSRANSADMTFTATSTPSRGVDRTEDAAHVLRGRSPREARTRRGGWARTSPRASLPRRRIALARGRQRRRARRGDPSAARELPHEAGGIVERAALGEERLLVEELERSRARPTSGSFATQRAERRTSGCVGVELEGRASAGELAVAARGAGARGAAAGRRRGARGTPASR